MLAVSVSGTLRTRACADALDVHVDQEEKVWVVDVAPWGGVTDSGLWSWDEILRLDRGEEEEEEEGADRSGGSTAVAEVVTPLPMRVRRVASLRPDPLQHHRLPLEVVELAGLLGSGVSLEAALQAPSSLPADLASPAGIASALHTVLDAAAAAGAAGRGSGSGAGRGGGGGAEGAH